jgi:Lon protease-like protein
MVIHYELPLFPLRTVLFPGQTLPLHIFEPRYRLMIADCLETDRTFGVTLIREGVEVGGVAVPYKVGTTATIQDVEQLPDGRMNIITLGRERFRLQDYNTEDKPYLVGRVSPWPWSDPEPPGDRLSQTVSDRLGRYIRLLSQAAETEIGLEPDSEQPTNLAVTAAVVLQIPPEEKQALLAIPSIGGLLRKLDNLLRQESRALNILLASNHLQSEMDGMFSRN